MKKLTKKENKMVVGSKCICRYDAMSIIKEIEAKDDMDCKGECLNNPSALGTEKCEYKYLPPLVPSSYIKDQEYSNFFEGYFSANDNWRDC